MAIRPEIPDRTPLEKVEVEYVKPGSKEPVRPGFNRVRLLDISPDMIEIATREGFPAGEKLHLSIHAKGIRDFLQLDCAVKSCTRVTVLKQNAYAVVLGYGKLTNDHLSKITWARQQLVPRTLKPSTTVRRDAQPEEKPAAPAASAAATPAPEAVPSAPPEKTETTPTPAAKPEVRRPVALLHLIEALDKFEVTNDLIMAVIEAAESGMDVEVLYPLGAGGKGEAEAEESESEVRPAALPSEGSARPMNVYRLAGNSKIYFSEAGVPVGPPSELIYLSRLKSPEACFAVEMGVDTMVQTGAPSFKPGCILVFSTAARVENGDFAFLKVRGIDEVGQVFFDKDEVRVRPLNPEYREKVLRRNEIKVICRLVGHYEDMSPPA